ncbi:unnamed protein product [Triticum turgidum subsp. durum]|uniref:Uncharacterized protein n=1 Tax=Triticum turgidum subsp. durum TaxID=4567 RepID=A0A9R0Q1Y1_TRITD|nr:unnamed protein product [Triticum turgidum subsp. durum]
MLVLKDTSHKTSFVALKRTIRVSLNLIDPVTSDETRTGRKRNKIPRVGELKSNNLLCHGKLPFGMNNIMIRSRSASARKTIAVNGSLIVEAEKAANALEPVAAKIPFAQASLIEARKLVTEARMSLEGVDDNDGPAESSSDDTSDDSGVSELHKLENQNDLIKQENKFVNGMKLPPRTVNGMDFYFDVSALGEKEQLSMFQRIENSMERAYLLPSAFSTAQDVNGNPGTNDLYISEQVVNNDQIDRIAADTTEFISAEPLEDVSSPANKSKMRWDLQFATGKCNTWKQMLVVI